MKEVQIDVCKVVCLPVRVRSADWRVTLCLPARVRGRGSGWRWCRKRNWRTASRLIPQNFLTLENFTLNRSSVQTDLTFLRSSRLSMWVSAVQGIVVWKWTVTYVFVSLCAIKRSVSRSFSRLVVRSLWVDRLSQSVNPSVFYAKGKKKLLT